MNPKQEGKMKSATKTISVRLPVEEAERVKAEAEKAGLNVNDYLHRLLTGDTSFVDIGEVDSTLEDMTRLERLLEERGEALGALSDRIEEQGLTPENATLLDEEINKGRQLTRELTTSYERVLDAMEDILKEQDSRCKAIKA